MAPFDLLLTRTKKHRILYRPWKRALSRVRNGQRGGDPFLTLTQVSAIRHSDNLASRPTGGDGRLRLLRFGLSFPLLAAGAPRRGPCSKSPCPTKRHQVLDGTYACAKNTAKGIPATQLSHVKLAYLSSNRRAREPQRRAPRRVASSAWPLAPARRGPAAGELRSAQKPSYGFPDAVAAVTVAHGVASGPVSCPPASVRPARVTQSSRMAPQRNPAAM